MTPTLKRLVIRPHPRTGEWTLRLLVPTPRQRGQDVHASIANYLKGK